MDKYILHILRLNVFIHNELSKCGRMAGWETRDPRRDLRFPRLESSRIVLIRQTYLGCFIMRASMGAAPIE